MLHYLVLQRLLNILSLDKNDFQNKELLVKWVNGSTIRAGSIMTNVVHGMLAGVVNITTTRTMFVSI